MKSTDNNTGVVERTVRLPQTARNEEIADKVNALLVEWQKVGVPGQLLTRRQARKYLQKRPNTKVRVFLEKRG